MLRVSDHDGELISDFGFRGIDQNLAIPIRKITYQK